LIEERERASERERERVREREREKEREHARESESESERERERARERERERERARERESERARERETISQTRALPISHTWQTAEASKAVGREGETSSSLTHRRADSRSEAEETCQLILLGLFRRDVRSLLILLGLFRRRSLLASFFSANIRAEVFFDATLGIFLQVSFWHIWTDSRSEEGKTPKKNVIRSLLANIWADSRSAGGGEEGRGRGRERERERERKERGRERRGER
jgi:hypothetical protein